MSNRQYVRYMRHKRQGIKQYVGQLEYIKQEIRGDLFYLVLLTVMMAVMFLTLWYPGHVWWKLGVFGVLFFFSGLLRCGYTRYTALLKNYPVGVVTIPVSASALTPTEWESVLWFVYGPGYLKRLNNIVQYQIHKYGP